MLPTSVANDLHQHLHCMMRNHDDDLSLLTHLSHSALHWITQNHIDLEKKSAINDKYSKSVNGKNKYKKRREDRMRNQDESQEEVVSEKKSSMKTADDVIKRIQWDPHLCSEHFLVGYLDRFLGIQEKYFSAFSWEDLASVDYDTLAVPKHRIQYFKYKNIVIWDKNTRLDNVFGSTGSGITVIDVVTKEEAIAAAAAATVGQPTTKTTPYDDDDYEDTDDEDDDVTIKLTDDNKRSKEESSDSAAAVAAEPYWGEKQRPTHFLALRITNPDVRSAVKKAHGIIEEIEPIYKACCIGESKLHVTLCCLGLDTEEQVARCVKVLHSAQSELQAMKPTDIELKFEDTDSFFLNTVYAKVECEDSLYDFVNHIVWTLMDAGIQIRNVFDFVPHMTIMKFSRELQRETHTKYVDPRVFEALKGMTFSSQILNNIHLCVMSPEVCSDGFYVSPTTMFFD